MRQFLLLCLFSIETLTLNAQGFVKPDRKLVAQKLQNYVLQRQLKSNSQAKTTATQKRLTGHSRYEGSTLTDSTRHVYHGTLGSSLVNDESYFSATQFTAGFYDAANPLSTHYIQSDTSWAYMLSGGSMVLQNMISCEYDAGSNLTRVNYLDQDGSHYDYHECRITSNGAGQRSTVQKRDTTGGSPIADKDKYYFIYDNNGKIIRDSGVYNSIYFYRAIYSYDASGNLTSYYSQYFDGTNWSNFSKSDLTYDANNRVLTHSMSQDDGSSGWVYNGRNIFSYTGNAAQYTYSEYQDWNTGTSTWERTEGEINELDGAGRIQHNYSLKGTVSKLDTSYRADYTYNTANLYDQIAVYRYVGGNYLNDAILHFYYEDYSSTGIATLKTNLSLSVFPNPGTGLYNVNAKEELQQINITDGSGKMVRSIYPKCSKAVIDLRSLPSGVYFLMALSANDATTVKVIKQ